MWRAFLISEGQSSYPSYLVKGKVPEGQSSEGQRTWRAKYLKGKVPYTVEPKPVEPKPLLHDVHYLAGLVCYVPFS